MSFKKLLLSTAVAASLLTAPVSVRADGTGYDDCMDKAEERYDACLEKTTSLKMQLLCLSSFGYQKLYCTGRYIGDILE